MVMNLTEAKPYAKAIFALALREQQLSEWQDTLSLLALVATECKKKFLLNNPKVGRKQELDFFYSASQNSAAINLVRLLAERKKLAILPNIAADYQQLLFAYEKTLEAKIITASKLTDSQKKQLTKALQKRHLHKILLQCHVDTTLIGGAVIHIAGQVIDGSIKGMLQRLKQSLLRAGSQESQAPC